MSSYSRCYDYSLITFYIGRAAGGFDNFFPVQEGEGPGWEGGSSPFLPVSPEVMKRRRGGLIEQRDIIKAHEAHKMQSTPQARRKEWE